MKVFLLLLCFALPAAAYPQSGNTAAAAPATTIALNPGTLLDIELTKSLDVKKVKPGDPVEARLRSDVRQDGAVVIRRGSKITGQVTLATTKAKGAPSQLGIEFDKVIVRTGDSVPLMVALQAMAAGKQQGGVTDSGMVSSAIGTDPGGRTANSPIQKTTADVEGSIASMDTAAMNTAGFKPGGTLTPSSKGVFGMEGIGLKNEIGKSAVQITIFSPSENIHLDAGTEMLLRSIGQ